MEENKATEANAQPIAPAEDSEARFARLEAEKAKLAEEKENYRKAYLKEVNKDDDSADEEGRLRKIAREELANSRLVDIAREQDELIRQTLKENKELKLAHLNKSTEPPATIGSHSESTPVRDTLVTQEQMTYFKSKGWSDQDIERYKKNLQKGGGR